MKTLGIIIAALGQVARSEITMMPAIDTAAANFGQTGCPVCLRTGNVFCSNRPYYNHYDAGTSTKVCCKDLTAANCATAVNTGDVVKDGFDCISMSTWGQQGILACPQMGGDVKKVCSPTDTSGSSNIVTFANKNSPEVTKQIKDLPKDEKCTFVIKAECDAPGFTINEPTLENVLQVHYMEWDPLLTNMDLLNNQFPLRSVKPIDVLNQENFPPGELPWLREKTYPETYNSIQSRLVPAKLVINDIANTQAKYNQYNIDLLSYNS